MPRTLSPLEGASEWLDVTPPYARGPYARGRGGLVRLAFVFDGGEELLLERLNAAELFLPLPVADMTAAVGVAGLLLWRPPGPPLV